MLQGNNIVNFSEAQLNNKAWANMIEFVPIFLTNEVPAFIFVTDQSSGSNSLIVRDAETDASVFTGSLTVTSSGSDTIVKGGGNSTSGKSCGYYYLDVVINGKHFYSDVFGWVDSVDDRNLIKISYTTTDLRLGGRVDLPYNSFTVHFYLSCNGITIESEIDEEGVEKPFGVLPVYNTCNIKRVAEINGTAQIFRHLSMLRVIGVNGGITLEYKNESKSIYETEVEVKDSSEFGETMIIDLTYKEYDFISTKNEI